MYCFYEMDDCVKVIINAAGMDANDVVVKVSRVNGGDLLRISVKGNIADTAPEYIKSNFGSIDEMITNDDFNDLDYEVDDITWAIDNGILVITLPKTELAKGRVIEASDNVDANSTGVNA